MQSAAAATICKQAYILSTYNVAITVSNDIQIHTAVSLFEETPNIPRSRKTGMIVLQQILTNILLWL